MALITARGLGMRFGPHDIFENISIAIHHGERAALVGPNGQGKTTLLRLLVGEETPTAGQVFRAKDLRIGYLRQESARVTGDETLWQLADGAFEHLKAQADELAALEKQLADDPSLLERYGQLQEAFERAGGYHYPVTIERVLTGLGFDREDYHRPLRKLSGGQQSRAHLARLLLERPQLLLLDEPTNHLDMAAIEWLESFLSAWSGALLIVSHDRYFLDKVVNRVFELSFDRLETYRGNYSQYVQQRAERRARREKEYRAQQAFIAKEEEFIRRNLAGQRTKEAQGRRKRLERLKRDRYLERPRHQRKIALSLRADLRSGDLVLATHNLVLGYPGGAPILAVPDLEIRRGERVALVGPNGSGKTTFLKTIVRQIPPKRGSIRIGAAVETGYFAQIQSDLNPQNTVLDEILQVNHNMAVGEARNHLGRFLFSGDDVFKKVNDLSGGERNRLALAKFALSGANFLLLDEPTNHLDIPAREVLEAVLADFNGTILLISHDRYFLDKLATRVWAIEGGSITDVAGNYTTYLTHRQTQETIRRTATPPSAGRETYRQAKLQRRARQQRARQMAELEAAIEATQERLAYLTRALEEASYARDVETLHKLGLEYQQTEETLTQLLDKWIAMEAA